MAVRLSIAVQHHPARPLLPERLRRALGCSRDWLDDALVTDPDPDGPRNPWRCAREAWRQTPPECTHRLVIQDDALPCRGFVKAVRAALAAKPDRITSFFLGAQPVQTHIAMLSAQSRGEAWVVGAYGSWVPAIALAVPVDLVDSLVEFDDGTTPIADDEVYGRWTRLHGLPWHATIPSLVDHDDDAPSLMRDPYNVGARCAVNYIGDGDPAGIDWTRG